MNQSIDFWDDTAGPRSKGNVLSVNETLRDHLTPPGRGPNFHQMLDALPTAVYTTDAAGHITYYNDAAATLWGHRPALGSTEWCGSLRLYRPDGAPMAHDECPMAIALKEKR
ncbi:MAG TPA: PAS domain-containing protein, partial [Pseudolabrys sp.]|nr:PAS domain-containing protein [Pseudolabrys sp.]